MTTTQTKQDAPAACIVCRNNPNDYTHYLLSELDQIQKQLATLTAEIEKWTKTK